MALVDFHCHLDLYPDHTAAIAAAENAGVHTLTVTTTPKAWPRNYDLTQPTRRVRAALGLHPQVASERIGELPIWEKYLPQARYVGEVGLDAGPRFYRSLDVQKRVFAHMLQACAEVGGKILSVHSVRAASVVLDHIEAYLPPERGRVVLHWFTGSLAEARRAAALGCYFSVNAEMLRTSRHREFLAQLPRDRLLTETDGPFTYYNGRPSEPKDVENTIGILAQVLDSSPELIRAEVSDNLRTLVSLERT